MNYYEIDGISIYMEAGLKIIKNPVNIWIEKGLSYESIRIDNVRSTIINTK